MNTACGRLRRSMPSLDSVVYVGLSYWIICLFHDFFWKIMFQTIKQTHWSRNLSTHCCYMLFEVKVFISYDVKKFYTVCFIYTTWIYLYGWQNEVLYILKMNELTLFNVYFKCISRNPIENTCKLIAQNGWYWNGCNV